MTAVTVIVETEIDGTQSVIAELLRRSADLSPLMGEIAPVIYNSTMRSFATESTPQGIPWAELAESTQKARARKHVGPSHPILRETSDLYTSIQMLSGSDFAEVGTDLADVYPALLMSGTAKMVAREYLGIGDQDEAQIIELAYAYLAEPLP